MEFENFFNSGNENFSLKGYKCAFAVQASENGSRLLTVRNNIDEPLYYAFSPESGLCLTTQFGSIQTSDLLGKLVSLPDNSASQTLSFFEEYGFLFPIPKNEDVPLDLKAFVDVLYRIKSTMLLQSLLGEITPDYEKILSLTLYLILSHRVELQFGEKNTYYSCKHRIMDLLEQPIFTFNESYNTDETIQKNSYTIADTVYPPSYELNADEYGDIMSAEPFTFNYPGIKDIRYRKLVSLYKTAHSESRNSRIVIDFLFHFMNSIGVIEKVDYLTGITFYNDGDYNKFDEPLKKALLNVARIVLSTEINYNIGKMRPYYSPIKLEGTWKAPNLLTALYFSIFYRNPGIQIYRKCANPPCHNYFLVSVTNERKRYCCDACRNANNQRTHRLKVKKSR